MRLKVLLFVVGFIGLGLVLQSTVAYILSRVPDEIPFSSTHEALAAVAFWPQLVANKFGVHANSILSSYLMTAAGYGWIGLALSVRWRKQEVKATPIT